jgi:hypothetical protein
MLTLTPTATEAVRGLVASSEIEDEGGVSFAVRDRFDPAADGQPPT